MKKFNKIDVIILSIMLVFGSAFVASSYESKDGRKINTLFGWAHSLSSWIKIMVDPSTGSLVTVDHTVSKMHSGDHYFIGGFDGDMGSGVSKSFTVYVPADTEIVPHMKFLVISNKILTYWIYEETPGSTAVEHGTGVPLTAVNNNRNSNNTSGIHVTYNPNVYDTGALSGNSLYMDSGKFGTAGQGNANDIGGEAGHNNELQCRSGTTTIYWFVSGEASAIVSYRGWWGECTNRN